MGWQTNAFDEKKELKIKKCRLRNRDSNVPKSSMAPSLSLFSDSKPSPISNKLETSASSSNISLSPRRLCELIVGGDGCNPALMKVVMIGSKFQCLFSRNGPPSVPRRARSPPTISTCVIHFPTVPKCLNLIILPD
jgi:hypothetical protein